MKAIQVGELKANLSKILESIKNNNEKFIVEYGKKRQKIAMLIPYKEKKKRKFGLLKDKLKIPLNFNEEFKDINDLFYQQNEHNS